MPHLRSVYKGIFLLLREGVTSLMRTDYMYMVKSLKFRNFRGLHHQGPHRGVALVPRGGGGLKPPPDPMPLKKTHAP